MGFHVTLKNDDRRLLDALRSNPAEVFGRPYAGYLLFLIGGADSEALDWLKKHIVPLDSLTGEHVAFAVFADRVPVELDIPYNPREALSDPFRVLLGAPAPFSPAVARSHSGRFLGEVPLTDVRRIDSYIKSGKLGDVADGDHLNAMTYATDRVARSFGVLESLPCLVVLDALASEEVEVIHLSQATLSELFSVLRSALHRLTTDEKFSQYVASLELLARLQDRNATFALQVSTHKRKLAAVPVIQNLEKDIEKAFNTVVKSIRSGSVKEFQNAIAQLSRFNSHVISVEIDEDVGKRLVGYGRTLKALRQVRTEWPLDAPANTKYHELLSKHVSRLAPEISEGGDSSDHEALLTATYAIEKRQDALVQQILALLPHRDEVFTDAKQVAETQRKNAERQLQDLQVEIQALHDQAQSALQFCESQAPSLRKILGSVMQNRKLKSGVAAVRDKASAYAGKILDPSTLLKVITAIGGSL